MPNEQIDVVDHSVSPPELVCSFYYSDAAGVTCSSPEHLALLAQQGIATPPDGDVVYPKDGRKFFDALPAHFSGILRADRRISP